MRKSTILFTYLILALLLTACGNEPMEQGQENSGSPDVTKISNDKLISQQPSNEAKDILDNYEEITAIKAVNTKDSLFIAIEVEHHERFTMSQLEKKHKKEMKEHFKDMKIEFSTDKKIVLELEKLEQKINHNDISKKEMEKKFKQIVNLAKEQT
ncbi:hypothetical protein [Oceanobacillus rekensis]|uniref:hypothetical protein n=1 Tax=Oceanobacillus rekensis TaxID=937927 RepID=UPI000B43593E|nr:hypothetical protein [Oceanobacillus rekensis]